MLYANHRGSVVSNPDGQDVIMILKSTVQAVARAGCAFVFTDGHGVMAPLTAFYDDLSDLHEVPWDVLTRRYWHQWPDGSPDPDGSRKRQAEFMVHRSFPWRLIKEIGVLDQALEARVRTHLANGPAAVHRPQVRIQQAWYF